MIFRDLPVVHPEPSVYVFDARPLRARTNAYIFCAGLCEPEQLYLIVADMVERPRCGWRA